MTCQACGGVVGRDCFNPQECMEITRMQAEQGQMACAELEAAVNALRFVANGWKWEMLPNGERGWRLDGYLKDAQLRQLLSLAGKEAPKELDE